MAADRKKMPGERKGEKVKTSKTEKEKMLFNHLEDDELEIRIKAIVGEAKDATLDFADTYISDYEALSLADAIAKSPHPIEKLDLSNTFVNAASIPDIIKKLMEAPLPPELYWEPRPALGRQGLLDTADVMIEEFNNLRKIKLFPEESFPEPVKQTLLRLSQQKLFVIEQICNILSSGGDKKKSDAQGQQGQLDALGEQFREFDRVYDALYVDPKNPSLLKEAKHALPLSDSDKAKLLIENPDNPRINFVSGFPPDELKRLLSIGLAEIDEKKKISLNYSGMPFSDKQALALVNAVSSAGEKVEELKFENAQVSMEGAIHIIKNLMDLPTPPRFHWKLHPENITQQRLRGTFSQETLNLHYSMMLAFNSINDINSMIDVPLDIKEILIRLCKELIVGYEQCIKAPKRKDLLVKIQSLTTALNELARVPTDPHKKAAAESLLPLTEREMARIIFENRHDSRFEFNSLPVKQIEHLVSLGIKELEKKGDTIVLNFSGRYFSDDRANAIIRAIVNSKSSRISKIIFTDTYLTSSGLLNAATQLMNMPSPPQIVWTAHKDNIIGMPHDHNFVTLGVCADVIGLLNNIRVVHDSPSLSPAARKLLIDIYKHKIEFAAKYVNSAPAKSEWREMDNLCKKVTEVEGKRENDELRIANLRYKFDILRLGKSKAFAKVQANAAAHNNEAIELLCYEFAKTENFRRAISTAIKALVMLINDDANLISKKNDIDQLKQFLLNCGREGKNQIKQPYRQLARDGLELVRKFEEGKLEKLSSGDLIDNVIVSGLKLLRKEKSAEHWTIGITEACKISRINQNQSVIASAQRAAHAAFKRQADEKIRPPSFAPHLDSSSILSPRISDSPLASAPPPPPSAPTLEILPPEHPVNPRIKEYCDKAAYVPFSNIKEVQHIRENLILLQRSESLVVEDNFNITESIKRCDDLIREFDVRFQQFYDEFLDALPTILMPDSLQKMRSNIDLIKGWLSSVDLPQKYQEPTLQLLAKYNERLDAFTYESQKIIEESHNRLAKSQQMRKKREEGEAEKREAVQDSKKQRKPEKKESKEKEESSPYRMLLYKTEGEIEAIQMKIRRLKAIPLPLDEKTSTELTGLTEWLKLQKEYLVKIQNFILLGPAEKMHKLRELMEASPKRPASLAIRVAMPITVETKAQTPAPTSNANAADEALINEIKNLPNPPEQKPRKKEKELTKEQTKTKKVLRS